MSLPRIQAPTTLPELSAMSRLRGAFYVDLSQRLPSAMRARISAGVRDGDIKKRVAKEMKKAAARGLSGSNAVLATVEALLLGEVVEVEALLKSETEREYKQSSSIDSTIAAILSPETSRG